ncbi:Choline transporter-like protein [Raphanus sativus]|nr:Choline transporter-like protein [Raphanus sativus]
MLHPSQPSTSDPGWKVGYYSVDTCPGSRNGCSHECSSPTSWWVTPRTESLLPLITPPSPPVTSLFRRVERAEMPNEPSLIHLICLGFALAVLGLNKFRISDRLNIDRYTQGFLENHKGLTEDYWPLYAVAGGICVFIGWVWSLLLGSYANEMMKVSVHILTTYLAVVSVLCFWCRQFFWGGEFAVGALLQFLYCR